MNSAEIKQAMINLTPVIHKDIVYKRINAYIYRIYVSPHTHKYKEVYQLELQDQNGQSVTIANADDVTLLESPRGRENAKR